MSRRIKPKKREVGKSERREVSKTLFLIVKLFILRIGLSDFSGFWSYGLSCIPTSLYLLMSSSHFQIIIIGGGPIGLACGLEAKKAGLDYLILEKGPLVNSLYNYPANMTFFSTSERLEIGNVPFVSNNAKPTRSEALEYYRRVTTSHHLNIHLFEEVKEVRDAGYGLRDKKGQRSASHIPHPGSAFTIVTNKSSYTANHIIIATGFYDIPYLLNVPGENLHKVTHYYKEPHFYAFQKVIVVGAQNSAVDAALETWRKGAEVTMVISKEDIGLWGKYWVRAESGNRLIEGCCRAS